MLIFKKGDQYYVYIHIPKNSGKFMRKEIAYDKRNCIIESFWGICKEKNLDLAHIPYMLRSSFLDKNIQYQFTCHSRNPYDRIISAYFCLNPEKTIADFHYFCENVLSSYDFHMCFEKSSNDCNQQTEGDLPSDISGSSTFIDHKILNNSFNKDYIHYYPQYLFVCDENEQISNHTKIYKK
jgi:hypothetical protein